MLYIHSNYGYSLHKVASRSVNMFWPCPGFSWDKTRVHLPMPSFLGKKSWCPGFILEKKPNGYQHLGYTRRKHVAFWCPVHSDLTAITVWCTVKSISPLGQTELPLKFKIVLDHILVFPSFTWSIEYFILLSLTIYTDNLWSKIPVL